VTRICHEHCPPEGAPVLAALAAIAAVGLAVIVARIIESLFLAILIGEIVLGLAGIATIVYVLRRDRVRAVLPAVAPARTALPPARRSAAISAPRLRAIEAPRVQAGHPVEHCPRGGQCFTASGSAPAPVFDSEQEALA
jgi:hypothetical protein